MISKKLRLNTKKRSAERQGSLDRNMLTRLSKSNEAHKKVLRSSAKLKRRAEQESRRAPMSRTTATRRRYPAMSHGLKRLARISRHIPHRPALISTMPVGQPPEIKHIHNAKVVINAR